MIRKEPADHVFFNVKFSNLEGEAIAIYQNKVVAIDSIPTIFSNFKGFEDYNAQGFFIVNKDESQIIVGQIADGIVVTKLVMNTKSIIWEIVGGKCISKNIDLLDPHWDDH